MVHWDLEASDEHSKENPQLNFGGVMYLGVKVSWNGKKIPVFTKSVQIHREGLDTI